eukprot:scaffold16942_cov164-Skeletonema_marinoi.AAC.2
MASTQLNSSQQPTTEMEATEGTARKPSPPVNTKWHESSQNAIVSSNDFATDFITHSMYNARAQAQAAQVYSNAQVQMGGGGGGGSGAYNPWPNHQQGTVFAGHYGPPQLQPMPQPLLPAMMGPLGLGHSNSNGVSIVDTITVKLRPGGDALTPPPVLQRALSDPSQLRLNQQPARSPSPSPPHPHPPYGENIPLLINVHKLRYDKRLKALIDKKDLMLNYNYTDNQRAVPLSRRIKVHLHLVLVKVEKKKTSRQVPRRICSYSICQMVGGKVLAVTYCRDTPRPISANNSVSTNNGTNSARNRKARRGQRQRRASASA